MKKLSMKAKLILVAFVISIIAQSAFQIMSMRARRTFQEGHEAIAKTAVSNWMDKIDRNLFERYGDVQVFALSEPARSGSPERITNFMNDMMGAYAPIYDLMIVTNAKGRVIAVNSVSKGGQVLSSSHLIGKDYSSEPWFKAAISGKVELGSAYVEDLVRDPDVAQTIGNDGSVMRFTAPIRDRNSGEILGVWSNRMSWEDVVVQLTKENTELLKGFGINHVLSFLMNGEGRYLVHPEGKDMILSSKWDEFEELKKEVGTGVFARVFDETSKAFTGEMQQAIVGSKGYSIYASRGWFARLEIPMEDPAAVLNNTIFAIATCLLILCLIYEFWSVNSLSKKFTDKISELAEQSSHLKEASVTISSGSQSIASASTEQASALQETASSIEEMSAMVKKSSDNASNSRTVAERSHSVAAKGKETVEEMIQAIEEINISNDKIMQQVEESNNQIGEIVKVITEIGNKTKVINDIVFQTKLLSFNASVEAARAGEHGKGFAVVAEEVGNLAQMSGNAAKEIADMLNSSIQQVEGIVQNTKQKVERLVVEGKEKVESGTVVAKQCGTILEEVVKNVGDVNRMVTEISTAQKEQSEGISEITRAMNQLDQVTHQNATTSNQQAESADALLRQSDALMNVVQLLEEIVKGAGSSDVRGNPAWTSTTHSEAPSPRHEGQAMMPEAPRSKAKAHQPPVKMMPFGNETQSMSPRAKSADGLKVVGGDTVPTENDPRFRDI